MRIEKKKKIKIVLSATVIVLLFLIVPLIAEGKGVPAFDFLNHTISKITAFLGPVLGAYVIAFIILAAGAISLFISSSILQWVINVTPEALTVMGGEAAEVVHAGWGFTVGIANMLLIVAFVAIAISIIVGTESLGLKKALPKLIIVALLMNFSLLFVGIGIDISNFLFNSIANQFSLEEGNILWQAVEPLFNLSVITIGGFFGALAVYAGTALIPIKGVVAAAVQLVAFPFLTPVIIQFVVIGLISLMMSAIFLLFAAILLMRIFIIQVLAIIAPIAFFCLIFPSTKKWWDMWLQHLVQWLFVGVAFIFFMYIGIALAPLAMDLGDPLTQEVPGAGFFLVDWWTGTLVSYFTLLVYFLVIFFIVRKFVPALASAAIAQAKSAVIAASPYIGAIREGGKKYQDDRLAESSAAQKAGEAMASWEPASHRGDVFRKLTGPAFSAVRRAGIGISSKPYERQAKEIDEEADKIKDATFEEQVSRFKTAIDSGDEREMLTSILGAKKGKRYDDFSEKVKDSIDQQAYAKMEAKAEKLGKKGDIQRALPVHALAQINRNVTDEREREKNIAEFMQKNLKGDKLDEGTAHQIISGAEKSDPTAQALVKEIIKQTSFMKKLIEKGEGGKGSDVIINMLADKAGVDPNTTSEADMKRMGEVLLKDFNHLARRDIERNPGLYMGLANRVKFGSSGGGNRPSSSSLPEREGGW